MVIVACKEEEEEEEEGLCFCIEEARSLIVIIGVY